MRYAVPALALCAIASLRADVCQGVAPAPSGFPIADADRHPHIFRVLVKPGGPAFRITIRSFPPEDWQDHFVHAGDIDLAACTAVRQYDLEGNRVK
jgi:hypothetical protein